MTDDECQPVAVSRRIAAPAHDIFRILADPARHLEFDGSESLRGAGSTAVISGVGDVFVMKMYFPHLGDYEMNNHVVEYEPDRLIGWEPEAGPGCGSLVPCVAAVPPAVLPPAASPYGPAMRSVAPRVPSWAMPGT